MNIFSSLRIYESKWTLKNSRVFDQEELNAISSATVVPSQFGSSVCFMMVNGGKAFIPLDQTSQLGVGETVDINKAELLTLSKEGEADIYRVKA